MLADRVRMGSGAEKIEIFGQPFLYKKGEFTEQWSDRTSAIAGMHTFSVGYLEDRINLDWVSTMAPMASSGSIYTIEPIDLTNVDSITADIDIISVNYGRFTLSATSYISSISTSGTYNRELRDLGRQYVTLDVSGLSGMYYINCFTDGMSTSITVDIFNIWLE